MTRKARKLPDGLRRARLDPYYQDPPTVGTVIFIRYVLWTHWDYAPSPSKGNIAEHHHPFIVDGWLGSYNNRNSYAGGTAVVTDIEIIEPTTFTDTYGNEIPRDDGYTNLIVRPLAQEEQDTFLESVGMTKSDKNEGHYYADEDWSYPVGAKLVGEPVTHD